jgi:AcrR family transcriptional regulator
MRKKDTKSLTADTPQKLIDVAIELFAANGFKGTSIRDIAKLTGMTISNIYYYFGNKDGLLLAILEHSAKKVLDRLRVAPPPDLGPLERFKRLLRTHLDLVEIHKREAKIFFLDEENLSAEGMSINRRFEKEIVELYLRELRALKEMGYIDYENLTILALNILGVINWHLRWYRPGGKLTLTQINDEVIRFILHGVIANTDPKH